VIGADILNVLFVAGISAAVTPAGLPAPAMFFQIWFPAMLAVLIAFRIGVMLSKDHMKRSFGVVLIIIYGLATVTSLVMLPEENQISESEPAVTVVAE